MSTGGKIVAVFFSIVVIYTTYPRVIGLLIGRGPEANAPASDGASIEASRKIEVAPPAPRDLGPVPVPYYWQEKILQTRDYAPFVREAKSAAEGGNADAQFALYGAFSFCRDGMRKRTAEERRRIPEEMWKDMHERCDALAAEYPNLPLEADRWLARALDAKFPRALAFSALEDLNRLGQATMKSSRREKLLAGARSRMVEALRSNDPAITWIVAESLPSFFPGDARVEQANWVWRLAACEQGLGCGADAPWLHDSCLMRQNCMPGETGAQYIRRASGDFSSLLARARTLASALRNSTLDDAGFDATVTSLPVKRKSAEDSRPAARLAR